MNTDDNPLEAELAPLKASDSSDKREFAALIESASDQLALSPAATSEALVLQSEACIRLGDIFHLDAKRLFKEAQELSANDPDSTPRKVARSLLSYLASANSTSPMIRSLAAEMIEEGYGKY
ncbi:MAG: hypothetical protein ABI946_00805 [Chthoniobacterales bacterium]